MRSTSSHAVTELLARWGQGDSSARDALIPLVYEELRRIARRCLNRERGGHTLQATALVHEAYLRLAGSDAMQLQDRTHFFALSASIMRQILVDHARKRMAAKRGGNAVTIVLDDVASSSRQPSIDVLILDDALQRLATFDPRQSEIVELRFFGGLSIEEAAAVAKISPATAKRDWTTARLWLHRAISGSADE